jgi:hypothetical protein
MILRAERLLEIKMNKKSNSFKKGLDRESQTKSNQNRHHTKNYTQRITHKELHTKNYTQGISPSLSS